MSDPSTSSRPAEISDLAGIFAELDRNYVPHLSVNCVVFAYRDGCLQVLLHHLLPIEKAGLPGAYVRRDESLDHAAIQALRKTVGLEAVFIRQFHTFGGIDRVEPAATALFQALGAEPPPGHWIVGRVVSVGYFALVDMAQTTLMTATAAEECIWCELTALPLLVYDHNLIIEEALATLRHQLDALPLDTTLLPQAFTMPELQLLYETVHGRLFDRRNFQKRILDLGLVERLEERRTGGRHRPAYLYRWVGEASDATSPTAET